MSGETTRSSQMRKEGNSIFVTATDNLAPAIRLLRFEKALRCYRDAYGSARDDDEKSSAAKNVGVVQWKISRHLIQTDGTEWLQIKYRVKEALSYFCMAYRTGVQSHRPTCWTDNILASCRGCWEELYAFVEYRSRAGTVSDDLEKVTTIREFVDYIPIPDMKADCFMEIAEFHFHKAITDLAKDAYKGCLFHLRECHFPMHEAMKYGTGIDHIHRQFNLMEEDIVMQNGLAQSMQSRDIGDKLFEKVIMDTEMLNTDMVWEIIDWYKDSTLKVRGIDVRNDAISMSRIGMVYEKILKIRFRAKDYLQKAVEIAHLIQPMNVTNEKWYKDTAGMLEQFQKETVMHEQEEDNKRKAAAKEKIKTHLDLIKEHSDKDSNIELLRFFYSTFKPKNPEHKLKLSSETKDLGMQEAYKLLQMAVVHYHPDRVNEEEHGLEQKVLHEEITKVLTARYQNIKMAQ